MTDSLVPMPLLKSADKILFVAHLALGDFTYLQSCFQVFARAYPHIKIHLWVDERRRTKNPQQWEELRKYSLYDWLEGTSLFDKIYKETYSPDLYNQSIKEAQDQHYPIVVSLAVLQRHLYAKLIREISPNGFVVGQKRRIRPWQFIKRGMYRKLDAVIPAYVPHSETSPHISEIYASWFKAMFGIEMSAEQRFPIVPIPPQWMQDVQSRFSQWGFSKGDRVFFLNAFSKVAERSWPLSRVIELATALRNMPEGQKIGFIVNVVPEQMEAAKQLFDGCSLDRIQLFSAEDNFYQLPAMLSLCTMIISVETAVMHLANAVHVPVIALMRRVSPEWTPIDTANSHVIMVRERKGWVSDITADEVIAALPSMKHCYEEAFDSELVSPLESRGIGQDLT